MRFVPLAEKVIKAMMIKDPENVPNLYQVFNRYQKTQNEISFDEFFKFCMDYKVFDLKDAMPDVEDDIRYEVEQFLIIFGLRTQTGSFYLDKIIEALRSLKPKSKEQLFQDTIN